MRSIVWIIFAGLFVSGLVFFVDPSFTHFVGHRVPPEYQRLFSNFSKNGVFLFYAIFGALFGYAQVAHAFSIKRLCGAYLRAQVVFSFALVRLLKIGVGRARPASGIGFHPFTLESEYNSFPSGHAADIFTGAVLLYLLLGRSGWRRWRHLPLLYAGLVAIARVTGGVHHLADVAAGAAIGIGGAVFFYNRSHSKSAPDGRIFQF